MDAPIDTEAIIAASEETGVSPLTLTDQARRLQDIAKHYLDLIIRIGFDPDTEQAILHFSTDAIFIEGDEMWPVFAEMADVEDATALKIAHERALPTRATESAPLGIALPPAWQDASRAYDEVLKALIRSDAATAGAIDFFFVRLRGWGKSEWADATGRSPQAVSNNVGTAAKELEDTRWPTLDHDY